MPGFRYLAVTNAIEMRESEKKNKIEAFLGHLFHPSAGVRSLPTIYMLEIFSV